MLFDLGLDNEVVGITKFCVRPQHWRQTKTIIGGTKNVNFQLVESLRPDLIIANKEENTKEDVEKLRKFPTYISDIKNVDDAYQMMNDIADHTGRSAAPLVNKIKTSLASLPSFGIKKALYLIWKNPWMAAGSDTFINEMMKMAGFENVVTANRYPSVSEEEMKALDPEVVLLSSEPYPFKDQQVDELKKLLPTAQVALVDGEMFSWYGSRMAAMAEYFRELRSTTMF